ncbi:lycopene cyclase family protein [Paraflavitalea speifideaquila]|uniref:lycopene cyclase family protein n=1 Tax=Paraflavitalea speifideaquila TaxID=3076558 RepID=UPI0028EA315F|nr:lycopene cyclase family protein [Paraflavitalea speifideiaquila]
MNRFHYIIAGTGCAGLSFLVRLLQSGQYDDKKILLIDKAPKLTNDRTWCFWEQEPGLFDPIVYKSWQQLRFFHPSYSATYNIEPYTYKMIRAIDFYQYCLQIIRKYPNVTIEYAVIKNIQNHHEGAILETEQAIYSAEHIFSSILFDQPILKSRQYHLLQHFKGWVIETPQPLFNPAEATLMDFSVSQQHGTAFVYVMPFTQHQALVEYTLFTPQLLQSGQYDIVLRQYIHTLLNNTNYQVLHEETGAIPMTNYRYPTTQRSITWLGTAGGQTKASSGYTFQFIQKQTAKLVAALLQNQQPKIQQPFLAKRFHWYDATLLNILANNKLPGDFIFKELFKHNKITDVLRFLDNETSLLQEMKIITVLPKAVFIRAALQQLT